MRGWCAGIVLALVAGTARGAAAPSLTARAAIAMDAGTGEVLYERAADQPLPPASTTKVMTAILALESGRLDEDFTVSSFAAETAPSKINLKPGQRMRLRNLLYAVLLNSANDAAEVVAEGLAGSQEAFAARMNAKARAIGAATAHFENPHGLTAEGHVASARDLALIFRYGLRIPLFREILSTRTVAVPVDAPRMRLVALHSHNRLLTASPYPVIGKTGYTVPARRCFVGATDHDGREVVIALLGSSDLWGDARRLLAWTYGRDDRPPLVMASMVPLPRFHHRRHVRPAAAADEGAEPAARVEHAVFSVQVGPYRSRRQATAARLRLASRGYSAEQAGRVLRLGRFSNRSRASTLAQRLRLSGYRSTIVSLN
ncbi:MAG TPA: D-alanyl-D-alanine carboxypeptidase [Candidatus Binatia bacterium]|nr:D-alanyl-D-alanine carboxypeptidase [Candidatus Binatia bacterium]